MASYNGERFVGEAVSSILGQSFRDLELVVVDDGSGPATLAILRGLAAADPRMRLLESAHQGQIATLNQAIALCRAPLIARLDHDDIALPVRMARQKAYLDANTDTVAVGAAHIAIGADGRYLSSHGTKHETQRHRPDRMPPRLQWIAGPTPMFRAEALREAGGFRPQFMAAEDRDLCWRLGALGRVYRLPEVLVQHRVHDTNLSITARRTQLYSHALSDLSAIARHFGRDDSAVLATVDVGGDYTAVLDGYRRLFDGVYGFDTYWFYFLARYRAWPLAGYASGRALLGDIARHLAQRPYDLARLNVLRMALKYTRRPSELSVPVTRT